MSVLAKWADTFLGQIDLAGLILIALIAAMVWTMILAQRDAEFDLRQALLDDNGKVSFLRLAGLGAFAVHSWALMKNAVSAGPDVTLFVSYGVIWSGAPIAGKLIEALQVKWAAK